MCIRDRPALGEKLPGQVPIHLYQGLADDTVPASHADSYARLIPQAHLHRLPDRDHQLNNDLREVAAEIRSLPGRDARAFPPRST